VPVVVDAKLLADWVLAHKELVRDVVAYECDKARVIVFPVLKQTPGVYIVGLDLQNVRGHPAHVYALKRLFPSMHFDLAVSLHSDRFASGAAAFYRLGHIRADLRIPPDHLVELVDVCRDRILSDDKRVWSKVGDLGLPVVIETLDDRDDYDDRSDADDDP